MMQDRFDTPESVPDDFTLVSTGQGDLLIQHKRTGFGCMLHFFCVWITFWTIICIFLLYAFLAKVEMSAEGSFSQGDIVPLWFVLIFWVVDILTICFVIWLVFCKTTFHLTSTSLRVETDTLGFKRRKVIPKGRIRRVIQVQDRGKEEDCFPRWGLKVEGSPPATLLSRHPYADSLWLGRLIAEWAKVEFVPASAS